MIDENSSEELDTTFPKTEFQKLCATLPTIEFPYTVYCEDCCIHQPLNEEQKEIQKFLPAGSTFIQVISIEKEYVAIQVKYAADMMVPSIIIFNEKGGLIDEQFFMGGWCGYLQRQHFFINSKNQLLEIDTTLESIYDSVNFNIIETGEITITRKEFKINKTGIHPVKL